MFCNFYWTFLHFLNKENIQVVGSLDNLSSQVPKQIGPLLEEYATLLNAVDLLGRDLLYKLRATTFCCPGSVFEAPGRQGTWVREYVLIYADSKYVEGVCYAMGQILKKRG